VSEWWSYRLGSFLLFSQRTYGSLVASYNADVWPLQPVLVALGLAALVVALRSRSPLHARWVWLLLGGAWLWVAWAFHFSRFSTINWAAPYLAWVFALQGLALLWVGAVRQGLCFHARAPVRTGMGAGIVCLALLVWPLVVPGLGRPWAQAESFGSMPDPTAIATIGFLLLAPKAAWWLMAVPLAAGALGLTMAWGLNSAAA
jgi:hypothetical protein